MRCNQYIRRIDFIFKGLFRYKLWQLYAHLLSMRSPLPVGHHSSLFDAIVNVQFPLINVNENIFFPNVFNAFLLKSYHNELYNRRHTMELDLGAKYNDLLIKMHSPSTIFTLRSFGSNIFGIELQSKPRNDGAVINSVVTH